jgi:response regulator NasT
VADDEPETQDYYRTILPVLGHSVVAVAAAGRELVEMCRDQRSDLVATDVKMPDMDGIEAAARIYRDGPIPVILVSANYDAQLIRRAEEDHILAYLVKPIKQAALETAIAIALRRFEEFRAPKREAADLKQWLEDRKVIERAKSKLMKLGSLDESEAFRCLQVLAGAQDRNVEEIAGMLLTEEEAIQPPQPGGRRRGRQCGRH